MGQLGLLIATVEPALNPVPVMITGMFTVPAVHDAGDTPVIVVGSTRVRDVEAVIAGLPTLATIPTLAVLELGFEKSVADEAGAVYVAVVFPVDVVVGEGGVQLTTAFSAALVRSAAKNEVEVPFASSTFGLGLETEIDGTSKSIVTGGSHTG
jgi:hypothetical protein